MTRVSTPASSGISATSRHAKRSGKAERTRYFYQAEPPYPRLKFKPSEAPPGWYKTKTEARLTYEATHPLAPVVARGGRRLRTALEGAGGAIVTKLAQAGIKRAVAQYGAAAVAEAGAVALVAVAGSLAGYFIGKYLQDQAASDTWDMRRYKLSQAIGAAKNAMRKQVGRELLPEELAVFNARYKREIAEIDRQEAISHKGGYATYGKTG